MKKIYFLCAMIFAVTLSQAQYTFTPCSSILPWIGDSEIFTVIRYDTVLGMSSGAAGANVTWDFSKLVVDTTYIEDHHYLNPSSTPYAADFPKANWCDYLMEDSTYTYEIQTADSAFWIGNKSARECSYPVWINNLLQVCPTTFGESWPSNYFANACANIGTSHDYRKGTYYYDAYGTLKLPDTTFHNTARLKWVVTMSDTTTGLPYYGTSINIFHDTLCTWYDVSLNPPVFVFTYLYDNDTYIIPALSISKVTVSKVPNYYNYSHIPGIPTSIKEVNIKNDVKLYPNPSSNNLTIEASQSAVIEITNIQGQLVNTITATGNKTNLDVSALPCGVYLIKLITANGAEVRKFVKE
jgi:hypothetical protein